MEPSDVEASGYDLGMTSVKLIRAGNVVQLVFSNKRAAGFYYAETASRFKKEEGELNRR